MAMENQQASSRLANSPPEVKATHLGRIRDLAEILMQCENLIFEIEQKYSPVPVASAEKKAEQTTGVAGLTMDCIVRAQRIRESLARFNGELA